MPILILMALVACSGLTIMLTMIEGNVPTVRTALILKVLGLDLIFWAPLVAVYVIAWW